MPYSPTNWVEKVTTVGPTNLNKIETALTKMPYGPDASAHYIAAADGSGGWTYKLLTDSEIAAAAGISPSKFSGFPNDSTKMLAGDGTWVAQPSAGIGLGLAIAIGG